MGVRKSSRANVGDGSEMLSGISRRGHGRSCQTASPDDSEEETSFRVGPGDSRMIRSYEDLTRTKQEAVDFRHDRQYYPHVSDKRPAVRHNHRHPE